MTDMNVRPASGSGTTAIRKPNPNGRAAAALSAPIVFSTEDLAAIAALATALGEVQGSPTANTVLDRLKTIASGLTTLAGYVDGLEGLVTTLNGYVDGLETLITSSNTLATSLNGYADGLEGYVDGIEALLTAIAAQLPSSLGIKTAANSLSIAPASDATFIVRPPFQRNVEKFTSFTPSAAYSTLGACFGATGGGSALIDWDLSAEVGAQAADVELRDLHLRLAGTFTGATALSMLVFNANPSASTLLEAGAFALHANDLAKVVAEAKAVACSSVFAGADLGVYAFKVNAAIRLRTNSAGHVFGVPFCHTNSWGMTSPTATLRAAFGY